MEKGRKFTARYFRIIEFDRVGGCFGILKSITHFKYHTDKWPTVSYIYQ
jgi:hypothetical protein